MHQDKAQQCRDIFIRDECVHRLICCGIDELDLILFRFVLLAETDESSIVAVSSGGPDRVKVDWELHRFETVAKLREYILSTVSDILRN